MSDQGRLTIIRYLLGIGSSSGGNDLEALLPELARRIAISGMSIDTLGAWSMPNLADGTVTVPSLTFKSDPDSGFYGGTSLGGGNLLGLALNGASQILFGVNLVRLKSSTVFGWASGVPDQTAEDTTLARVAAGKLQLAGTTPMLLLGGATASFPALKRSGAGLDIRLADDSGSADMIAGTIAANTAFSSPGAISILTATAVPAGGTAGAGFKFSSTANLGLFFGSGVPSLSAAKGSFYMRTDGSSTSTRAYINTDGGTTWTAITTVA